MLEQFSEITQLHRKVRKMFTDVSLPGQTAPSADLGGGSKYSNNNPPALKSRRGRKVHSSYLRLQIQLFSIAAWEVSQ